jgi:hypothetical protein
VANGVGSMRPRHDRQEGSRPGAARTAPAGCWLASKTLAARPSGRASSVWVAARAAGRVDEAVATAAFRRIRLIESGPTDGFCCPAVETIDQHRLDRVAELISIASLNHGARLSNPANSDEKQARSREKGQHAT